MLSPPRHFARAFRAETGVTPGRYVERVRVDHARRLLEESGEGIAQIARACGYGNPEALRRAFVRTLGQPPAEYRRRFGTSLP
ncbi:helix-turn-helix domain-containing protein [Streptomyces avidinii]